MNKNKPRKEAPVIAGAFDGLNNGAIIAHQQRCAKVRNRNVSCLKCAEACTSGCISLVHDELVVDESKCVGCGTCATVCPTCALEARNPNDEALFSQCKKAMHANVCVIACDLALQAAEGFVAKDRVSHVVCAGRVDESLIVRLAAAGAREVVIVCGCCDACAQKHGQATAQVVVASANTLLEAWGSSTRATLSVEFPEEVLVEGSGNDCIQVVSTFFSQPRANKPFAGESGSAQVSALQHGAGTCENSSVSAPSPVAKASRFSLQHFTFQHVMEDGTLAHFLPDRRERLLEALYGMGMPEQERIDSRLWGRAIIDGTKCVSCRMCATFCPTGAISKFDDEDGTFGVYHYPADCVKCRSCQDICPAGAISLFDGVRASSLLEGEAHRYVMKERPTLINNPHQILSHMRQQMAGNDIFER